MSAELFPEQFKLPSKRYLTIAEAAKFCRVSPAALRYWEGLFPMLKPNKRGGRRYYLNEDIEIALKINHLVSVHGYKLAKARSIMIGSTYSPSSNVRRKLYAEDKRKESLKSMSELDTRTGFGAKQISEICRVTMRTATRYMSDRKAPHSVCQLMDLIFRKRVLPESWTHCFINHRGNLEVNGVGEVSENDILNIRWLKELNSGQQRALEQKLACANERIKRLEAYLDEARAELGQVPAANEPWREK